MGSLKVENISKCFSGKIVLKNVNLDITEGEFICILGPSGCGKTTLLRIIAGLENADCGKIYMDGRDCTGLPASKRNYGIVFQSYALFPNMTVEQNVLFGLQGQKQLDKKQKREKAAEVLKLVDLNEHGKKYPNQLSGGQQQRTALARAIVLSPQFLLLDEPLSALDAKVRSRLRVELKKIQRQLGITTIMVTHDQEEALTMADRIVVMNNSVIEQVGTPVSVYKNPLSSFVANFIGTMNFYNENDALLGIRPESIQLQKASDAVRHGCLHGKVSMLEFRGAYTRVYGKVPSGNELCVDLPSENALSMGLKEGDPILLSLSEQHLVKYSNRLKVG